MTGVLIISRNLDSEIDMNIDRVMWRYIERTCHMTIVTCL